MLPRYFQVCNFVNLFSLRYKNTLIIVSFYHHIHFQLFLPVFLRNTNNFGVDYHYSFNTIKMVMIIIFIQHSSSVSFC